MYGGHITDNWDRRTNNTYLKMYIKPELMQNINLSPLFKPPDNVAHVPVFKSPDASKLDF